MWIPPCTHPIRIPGVDGRDSLPVYLEWWSFGDERVCQRHVHDSRVEYMSHERHEPFASVVYNLCCCRAPCCGVVAFVPSLRLTHHSSLPLSHIVLHYAVFSKSQFPILSDVGHGSPNDPPFRCIKLTPRCAHTHTYTECSIFAIVRRVQVETRPISPLQLGLAPS
jgi:hypothetical protein